MCVLKHLKQTRAVGMFCSVEGLRAAAAHWCAQLHANQLLLNLVLVFKLLRLGSMSCFLGIWLYKHSLWKTCEVSVLVSWHKHNTKCILKLKFAKPWSVKLFLSFLSKKALSQIWLQLHAVTPWWHSHVCFILSLCKSMFRFIDTSVVSALPKSPALKTSAVLLKTYAFQGRFRVYIPPQCFVWCTYTVSNCLLHF